LKKTAISQAEEHAAGVSLALSVAPKRSATAYGSQWIAMYAQAQQVASMMFHLTSFSAQAIILTLLGTLAR
jgi:hypothetical protein